MNESFKNKKRTLGDNLKEARLRKGLLQSDVAKSLHLERSTYTSYETGRTSPSAETLFKLSAIYETSVLDLLGSDFSSSVPLRESLCPEYAASSPAPAVRRLQPRERELLDHFQALTEERQNKLLKLVRKMHTEQTEEEKAAKSSL
ncbi:MAG: helix-turn-helix transcriptional regulator [Candidatus Heritagella sp.]